MNLLKSRIRYFISPLLTVLLGASVCAKVPTVKSSRMKSSDQSTLWCMRIKTQLEQIRCDLAKAQMAKNLPEVTRLSQVYTQALGSQAGVPEASTRFHPWHKPHKSKFAVVDTRTAFDSYVQDIQKRSWWLSHPGPTEVNQGEPRDVASAITGLLAARRAGAKNPNRLLKMAKDAGNYLLWSQAQAGKGVYPYAVMGGKNGRWGEQAIASESKGGRDWQVNQKHLQLAQQHGRLSEVLVNGWIVGDLGEGGLQFHNALAGVAVLELYQATGERKYLDSARLAADWAASQPTVPNWNYNAFSIYLLANTYKMTGDRRYLESAKEKARLGVYPGQLSTGRYAGRWVDPHNARLVYHYILVRGLGSLVAVLPKDDPDFPQALSALSLALNRNAEFLTQGVPVNKDGESLTTGASTALEVLSHLKLNLPTSNNPHNQDSEKVIALLASYGTEEFAKGRLPVEPSAWGYFLETIHSNYARKTNQEN